MKKIVEQSLDNRKRKLQIREQLKLQSIQSLPEEKIVFPAYAFESNAMYTRVFPWKYNGFMLHLGSFVLAVDPGVDFFSRCIASNINVMQPNAVFVSHGHLDHYASASTMLEAMASEKDGKEIKIIASKEFYSQRLMSEWHLNTNGDGLKNVTPIIAEPEKEIILNSQTTLLPIELMHSADGTIGFIITYKNTKIGYISDTGYAKSFKTNSGTYKTGDNYDGEYETINEKHEYIKKAFEYVDYLVCNIYDFIYTKRSKTHLSGYDVIDILKGTAIKECILAHMNQYDISEGSYAESIAEEIENSSGIKTTNVGKDGYTLHF